MPGDAKARAALASKLVGTFESWGYDRVTTPPFEYADVLERGLEVDSRDLVRFVEPDTGEVALLRPDITPQIARIVASRLSHRPPPWRLCYHGSVVRRRRGRARKSGQRSQAGIECVGRVGLDADAEVISLAFEACAAVGLRNVSFELGQVRLAKLAIDAVPEAARADAATAMGAKDIYALEQVLESAGVPARSRKRALTLLELWGDPEDVLKRGRRSLRDETSRAALDELEDVYVRLLSRLQNQDGATVGATQPRIGVDLGELRGHAYYTGVSFTMLAAGPGEPLGGGGRYDELLGRFGLPAPATGFALDVGNVAWALERAGTPFGAKRAMRLVSTGPWDHLERVLRAAGVTVSRLDEASKALEFARAWGYDGIVRVGERVQVQRARDGKKRHVAEATAAEILPLSEWLLSNEDE